MACSEKTTFSQKQVGVKMLLPRITYVTDENAVNRAAQGHFELDYISELSTRDGMCDIYFIT